MVNQFMKYDKTERMHSFYSDVNCDLNVLQLLSGSKMLRVFEFSVLDNFCSFIYQLTLLWWGVRQHLELSSRQQN